MSFVSQLSAFRAARVVSCVLAAATVTLVPFEGKGHGFFNGKLSRPSSDGVDYNLTVLRTIEFLTARGYIAAKR